MMQAAGMPTLRTSRSVGQPILWWWTRHANLGQPPIALDRGLHSGTGCRARLTSTSPFFFLRISNALHASLKCWNDAGETHVHAVLASVYACVRDMRKRECVQISMHHTLSPPAFDPSFLAPVRSMEHSAVSTQQGVEAARPAFDWLIAGG